MSSTLSAATLYWDGASAAWNTLSAWSTDAGSATPDPLAVPGASDTATFNIGSVNADTTISLNAAQSVASLQFANTGATNLQGGGVNQALTLGAGGVNIAAGAGAVTIGSATGGQNVALTLGATQTWTNDSAGAFTVANNVTGAASSTLTLTVGGSGNTTINGLLDDGAGGTLSLAKTGAGYLRLGGAATTLNGTLDIQGGTVGVTNDFNAAGLTGSGTFENGTANDKWTTWTIATNQTFDGIIRNSDGGAAGLLGVIKTGAGTWTLTNNASNVGSNFTVNTGRVVLNNTGVFGAGNQAGATRTNLAVNIGNTAAANGVLEINGATVNYNNRSAAGTEVWRSTLNVGNNATGAGAVLLNSGSLSTNKQLGVGMVNGAYGAMVQSGGATTVGGFLAVALGGANGRGVVDLSGGTWIQQGPVTLGASGIGVMSLSGSAAYSQTSTGDNGLWVGENGTGMVNVSGSATLSIDSGNNGLQLGRGAAANGTANLLGGTVTAKAVYKGAGTGTLNFNGGTLAANTSNTAFLTGLTAAYVRGGGGIIDNGGHSITVGQALLAPTGSGVSATGLSASGGGFIAPPVVTITGGGGSGATAVATIDAGGNLTGIVVTNPGVGYTSAPTFALSGGGIGNTGAITGTATLVANTGGGMTFAGSGVTTLAGVNTFVGNTTINDGSTLTLADNASLKFKIGANGVSNQVAGAGTFTIDGDFDFDLSTAGTTLGNSWQVLAVSTLAETFGPTFSATSFTTSNAKWVKPANGTFYEFDPATGVLRVIADPGISYPPPTATPGNHLTSYVVGSDIVLNVSASGVGTLTYQWYYQADAGATPVAISGATGSSHTISSATNSSGGIYSVVVTDHAAESSGQQPTTATATFSTISVAPASDWAVAYYRFDEGADGNALASAFDAVGGNNLAPIAGGAPTYSSASVPVATIPATGAGNALAASFPAAGNNGLVAPTNGTLANTVFTDFTVEAYVRYSALGGHQTIVGRDDSASPGQGAGVVSLFYLQKDGNNRFRVELINANNTNLQVNSQFTAVIDTWYHVAAVGNATTGTLTLYVDGVSVGSVSGFTGLYAPTAGSNTPWTVGRGDYQAQDGDFLRGYIDEVLITRAALPPSQFLNSATGESVFPPTASVSPSYGLVAPGDDVLFTATASSNSGGTVSYQWYKGEDAIGGETSATLALSDVTIAADGVYSVVVTDSVGATVTTTVFARLDVPGGLPAPGARAIGLNFVGAASTETWAANWSPELGTLAPSVTAGFHPSANWNNSATVTGVGTQTTPLGLQESTGSTSAGAAATWSSSAAWAVRKATGNPNAVPSEKTPDATLLHGYIESRLSTGASVTVANIPYGSYDVFVYVTGGAVGRVGSLGINRPDSPTYYYRILQHDAYVPATPPTGASPYSLPNVLGKSLSSADALNALPATFVRFAGLTGSDLTVTAIDAVLNENGGGIAAIQIVDTTPEGAAYPPIVTSAPATKIVRGGTAVSFGVAATSQNSGTLGYQWQKDGLNISGQTSATLTLNSVTGAMSGNYTVVVTDTSSKGVITTSRSATLVVVDATRSLLINGDINTAASPTYVGDGILRADGSPSYTGFEPSTTVWNGILGAAGSATRTLAKESAGLDLSGVTFSYSGANGVEDNTAIGGIHDGTNPTPAMNLERDYLYANYASTTPFTATVGGLQALAGKKVVLYVYAVGKTTKTFSQTNTATVNDTAYVSLLTPNNHLNSPAGKTSVFGLNTNFDAGRNLELNNPESSVANFSWANAEGWQGTSAYVAFTGVVAADGTVSWTLSPDTTTDGGGLVPLVGFQLLVTGEDIAPAAPTGPVATAGNGQVVLDWNTSAGATSYSVRRSTSSGSGYAVIATGLGTTSYTDTSVVNGTTYYYVVTAAKSTPAAESGYSAEVSATPVNSMSALQSWRQGHFGTSANSGNAANTADPDGDGQSNLLEYALGTNPTVAGALPVTVARAGNFLTLTFSRIGDDTLVYTIEASDDLATWSTVNTYAAFPGAGSTTYTDTVPLNTQARRFLRLVVTAP